MSAPEWAMGGSAGGGADSAAPHGGGGPAAAAGPATGAFAGPPASAPAGQSPCPPLVAFDGVTVRYGRTMALNEVSMRVFPGETVAVLGPDGAGKTTLLRTMAGIVKPSSGRIDVRVSRASLGYAGAQFDLYGDLTVTENLRFFGTLRGLEPDVLEQRTEAMLELTGLQDARHRSAARLSGGMKKKLSLACALVHEPALLLLDEPTVGVDPVSRQELWDVVMHAVAGGAALVFTSCYLEEAGYADRLAAMARGQLIETSADRVMAGSAGWSAWVAPVPADRIDVRSRLAAVAHEPRVYLRPEGLTVLAEDQGAARALLAATVGGPYAAAALARSELTFEDAFVLIEGCLHDGAAAVGEPDGPR